MKTGHPVEVLNPYEWLPGYGESDIVLSAKDGDLAVTISYDGSSGVEQKELLFKSVCAFYKASSPGVNLLNIEHLGASEIPMGSLVQYVESEAAAAWTEHFQGRRTVKHYSIQFLSENFRLEIFSGDFLIR